MDTTEADFLRKLAEIKAEKKKPHPLVRGGVGRFSP